MATRQLSFIWIANKSSIQIIIHYCVRVGLFTGHLHFVKLMKRWIWKQPSFFLQYCKKNSTFLVFYLPATQTMKQCKKLIKLIKNQSDWICVAIYLTWKVIVICPEWAYTNLFTKLLNDTQLSYLYCFIWLLKLLWITTMVMVTGLFAGQHNTQLHGTITGDS